MHFLVAMNFSSALVFSVLISSAYCAMTQQEYNELMEIRKGFNVYNFSSSDYPAMFAIIAGISILLIVGIIFIVVGLMTMEPAKDSIIYRMTTTRMKKD